MLIGTASVALAGILAALKGSGKGLKEHTFLFQVIYKGLKGSNLTFLGD